MIMRFVEAVETGMGARQRTRHRRRAQIAEEGFTKRKTVFINYSGKSERLMIR